MFRCQPPCTANFAIAYIPLQSSSLAMQTIGSFKRSAVSKKKMLIDACGFAARFLLLPEVAVDGELASSEPLCCFVDHVDTAFLVSPVQRGASSPMNFIFANWRLWWRGLEVPTSCKACVINRLYSNTIIINTQRSNNVRPILSNQCNPFIMPLENNSRSLLRTSISGLSPAGTWARTHRRFAEMSAWS